MVYLDRFLQTRIPVDHWPVLEKLASRQRITVSELNRRALVAYVEANGEVFPEAPEGVLPQSRLTGKFTSVRQTEARQNRQTAERKNRQQPE